MTHLSYLPYSFNNNRSLLSLFELSYLFIIFFIPPYVYVNNIKKLYVK